MNRRSFLSTAGGSVALAGAVTSAASATPLLSAQGVDLKAVGLRPNAGEDVSVAFQTALDLAALQAKPLILPPGEYWVSGINLPENITLQGVPGLTRLIFSGNQHFLRSVNARFLWLEGLEFDGLVRPLPDQTKALLFVSGGQQIRIENCRFSNSAERGLHVEGSSGVIQSCLIERAMGRCGVMALQNRGLTIRGNTISDCSNNGILVHRWEKGEDRTLVEGNRIAGIANLFGGTGEWGNGINIFRAGSVQVTGNNISDCALSAIRANSSDNVQIVNNQCLRSGETAVYSEFGFQGAVISNNLIDAAAIGISIANFNEGGRLSVCSGNLIRNLKDDIPYDDQAGNGGVGIYAEADTSVNANVIENAARIGMALGWGPYLRDVSATGNVIRDAPMGVYVSVVEGAGQAMIANNLFSGCPEGAIFGYRWNERATGDLYRSETRSFPNLTVSGNRLS